MIAESNVAVVSTISRRLLLVGPASVPVIDLGRQGRRPYRPRTGRGAIYVTELAKQST